MSFKKGHSYIRVTHLHTKHVLAKALIEKGYNEFELIFAPKWSPDCGWSVLEGFLLPTYLGGTKKSALKTINELKTFDEELLFYKRV